VDDVPEHKRFSDQGCEEPFYVGSDFKAGSAMLARLVLERFPQLNRCQVLILCGPEWATPAEVRSCEFSYKLMVINQTARLHVVILDNWDTKNAVSKFQQLYRVVNESGCFSGGDVTVVYCGNDSILKEIDRHIDARQNEHQGTIELLGYDGTKAPDGS
jgi:DNA-binding LacI/PurR family transcriptional regulator